MQLATIPFVHKVRVHITIRGFYTKLGPKCITAVENTEKSMVYDLVYCEVGGHIHTIHFAVPRVNLITATPLLTSPAMPMQ